MSEALAQELSMNAMLRHEAPAVDVERSFLQSRIADSRLGRMAVTTLLAVGIGLGVEAASPDQALATDTPATAGELPPTVTLSFPGAETTGAPTASASASDFAHGKVTVLGYIHANGLPKKEITKSNCFWKDGVWNSGMTINSPNHPKNPNQVAWFWDPRETYVCHVPKSESPTGLAKAGNKGPNGRLVDDCGNFIKTTPPKHVVTGQIEVVRNLAKAQLRINAEAAALAIGRDVNGNICGVAEAEASASVSARLKEYVKAKGSVAVRLYGKLFGQAGAHASAQVTCGVGVPEIIPKNGTEGPGAGTPGQPGGPGAGGSPGSPTSGETCRDDASSTHGDMNSATSGDLMYGPADQFGYCTTGPDNPVTA